MTTFLPLLYFAPGPMELIIIGVILLLLVAPAIILIVALTVGLGSSSKTAGGGARVQCPHCAEWIMPQAVKCRLCGEDLTPGAKNQQIGRS